MTMRKPLRHGMIVVFSAVLAAAGFGCKSGALDRHRHAEKGMPAPTTSSAVGDVPASVLSQGKDVYDTGVKHASEAYEDVNQLATKAAGDLKAGAKEAQAEVSQTAQSKAAALRQTAEEAAKAVGKRTEQATDDLLNSIGPKDADIGKSASDPVVLPDPTTGQP